MDDVLAESGSTSITFDPSDWDPGVYTIIASSNAVPGCSDTCELRVLGVGLSLSRSRISRKSPSSQIYDDEYTTLITTTTVPAGFEDDVVVSISCFDPKDHNTPMGSLNKVSSNTWEYEGCEEPFSEVHPDFRDKIVWFKASMESGVCGETESPEVMLMEVCVFKYLTTFPVITLNPGDPGAGAEYQRAYDFIWDKYGTCLNTTGGEFASVTLADTNTVWHPSGPATATTSIFDNVTFGIQTFLGENFCASTIGYELKHTVGLLNQNDCVTYTWEVDHAGCTGLQGDELQQAQQRQQQECN